MFNLIISFKKKERKKIHVAELVFVSIVFAKTSGKQTKKHKILKEKEKKYGWYWICFTYCVFCLFYSERYVLVEISNYFLTDLTWFCFYSSIKKNNFLRFWFLTENSWFLFFLAWKWAKMKNTGKKLLNGLKSEQLMSTLSFWKEWTVSKRFLTDLF